MDFKVKPTQLETEIHICARSNVTPYVVSSPGMGKSSIVAKVAKKNNLKLIDLRLSQCTPEDLQGFPMRTGNKATFTPFDIFPIEGEDLPEGYNGWMLLLDEMSSAPKSVQAAAYKLILDRQVGSFNLHNQVAMVAAGNKATDKAIVTQMSTALQSRLIHYELELDFNQWIEWALENDFDHRIIGFLNFKKELLMDFNPEHSDRTFACPRTWEFLNRLIKDRAVDDSSAARITGTIGKGAGIEFIAFCKVYKFLPSISDIISNPMTTTVPDETSSQFAVSSMLVKETTPENLPQMISYINRFNTELKILYGRGIMKFNPKLRDVPDFVNLFREIARYISD